MRMAERSNETSAQRQSLIARKPVGGYRYTPSDEISISFETEGPSRLHPAQMEDNKYGYVIGEQSIPLVDLGTQNDLSRPSRCESYTAQSNQASQGQLKCSHIWLPVGLTWPYLGFILILTLFLGSLVIALTNYSGENDGLGADQNSSIFLFGWRFTPTLVAVIYSILLMITINDIQRTEPYARLSRTEGAGAESTLFQKPGFLFAQPFTAIRRRKNGGNRNWALFWGSIANITTVLLISPFSAALLSPTNLLVSFDTAFSRLAIMTKTPLDLSVVDDSLLFRTISTILLNTTTTAWVSNNYTVLPFWPSDLRIAPLGAVISKSPQQWSAETTVYQSELNCKVMSLQGTGNWTLNYTKVYEPGNGKPDEYSKQAHNMTSFIIASSDGCSLGYAVPSRTDEYMKRGLWSRAPHFEYTDIGNNVLNGKLYNDPFRSNQLSGEITPILVNSSTECDGRDVFFYAALAKFDRKLQAQGYVCRTDYYSANVEVTAETGQTSTVLSFDVDKFNRTKTLLGPEFMNISRFEDAFHSKNWTSKFKSPTYSTKELPVFGGPLVLVGAHFDYDLLKMINNPSIADQAREVKQRFLGESMQSIYAQIGHQEAESIPGKVKFDERRLLVSSSVGIILSVCFLLNVIFLLLVVFHTRLHRRPLNLSQDPAPISGTAHLVCSALHTRALFESSDHYDSETMIKVLDKYTFYLRAGILYARVRSEPSVHPEQSDVSSETKDWRPAVIRGRLLTTLLIILLSLVTGLTATFVVYRERGIYQNFLTTALDITFKNNTIEALAPYSIIPTLIAVGVKLWWESIDQVYRRLQPYISMARKPTRASVGIDSSYTTAVVGWAAAKSMHHRQWLLALVTIGTFFAQIFTVSMSALWEKKIGSRSYEASFQRDFEFRTIPAIFTYNSGAQGRSGMGGTSGLDLALGSTLSNNIGNILTSWLYAGIVEGASNATAVPWTNDQWVFAPVNLTSTLDSTTSTANVTLDTSALRARLECTKIDMSNTTEWLDKFDFTNRTEWNDTNIPLSLKTGYELKNTFPGGGRTYPFSHNGMRLRCCSNETVDEVGKASIGYWTFPLYDYNFGDNSIMIKWVTGYPLRQEVTRAHPWYTAKQLHWIWKEPPSITAVNCTAIFESANASVNTDLTSGIVLNHTILGNAEANPHALKFKIQELNVSAGVPYIVSNTPHGTGNAPRNFTVSYGHLFTKSLVNAANVEPSINFVLRQVENLEDHTFNFRLPGLNVDFPSYTALSLVGNDEDTLLDYDTLANVSSTVFSIFFKHFVLADTSNKADGAMYMNGSWGLQPLNSMVPSDLGPKSGTSDYLQDSILPSTTNASVPGIVTVHIEKLDLNPIAVILSLAILGFLLISTIVLLCWHRQYLPLLPRDVDTLGSVLGFVYGSEKLLAMVREPKSSAKKSDRAEKMVQLRSFQSHDGESRWGVEIVDEGQERGYHSWLKTPTVTISDVHGNGGH